MSIVVDLTHSPHARLRPVPITAVSLEDSFWRPRLERNREVTLPSQLRQCEETGRIDNFRRAAGKKEGPFQGIYFNDSDVYKWAEAASFALAGRSDPELDAMLDGVIAEIAAAQQPDGYLDTYFMFERESERFTNLKDMHEIYCAGHLIQAAVAHHRATGKRTLLDVATRLADCLDRHFGPSGRHAACGHEEAEMALVELYRETGERRYLALAQRMVDARGQTPGIFGNNAYYQDHMPFTEQKDMTGHAVRHMYLCCGAADVVAETGNAEYRAALDALWRSLTQRRMYVTGGAGSRYEGEAFGEDYELPNDRAYAETCAAIGSVMWNWRMLNITGEAKYADLLEWTLYNAVLPGLSLDGTRYFYENPLASRGKERSEWFGCACCPPNVARLLASLPGYFASTGQSAESVDQVWLHLYAAGRIVAELPEGDTIAFGVDTEYPWRNDIDITVEEAPNREVELLLRVPAWSEPTLLLVPDDGTAAYAMDLDGQTVTAHPTDTDGTGYHRWRARWKPGTRIRLTLRMPVRWIVSHPHVLGNHGRVALARGPLVYCLEQADNPGADAWDIALTQDSLPRPVWRPDLLAGVVTLEGEAVAVDQSDWPGRLYQDRSERTSSQRPAPFCAIPYYAWANRQAGPMRVWAPLVGEDRV